METNFDIIIVGSGPAGLTAGVYSARAGKKALVIEGLVRGGAMTQTEHIENYSGFKSTTGFELAEAMHAQAETLGVTFLAGDDVKEFDLECEIKKVITEGGLTFSAKNIILCMGTKSRRLGLPNEVDLVGMGVSYCATCDGFFFKNKPVVVAGGGDTALTDALYLKDIASKVYLVHRRVNFRAQAALIEKLKDTDIELVMDSTVSELMGEPLNTVVIKNVTSGEVRKIEANGLFVAIGTDPNTSLLHGHVHLDDQGYIITDDNMQTNKQGVYAAGDIRMKSLRQIITACSDGAIAATNASL